MKRLIFPLFMVTLLSCSDNVFSYAEKSGPVHDGYDDIMVSSDNLLLFANIGNNGNAMTRSDDSSLMVSLESLLDRSATIQISFKSFIIKQIPFIDNKDNKQVMLSECSHDSIDSDSLTVVKTFLIETVDTLDGTVMKNVATMIPDVSYVDMFGTGDISFLDKSTFTGIILYSDLYGTFEDVYVYSDGPISVGHVTGCEDSALDGRKRYLSILSRIQTRSNGSQTSGETERTGEIEASYCIAYAPIKLDPPKDPEDGRGYEGHEVGDNLVVGGGGGGRGRDSRDPITHTISLFAASGGQVSGSGVYANNQLVACHANADDAFYFDRWVGDLAGRTEHSCFQIESDIESTAYFDSLLEPAKKPCWNKAMGVGNPLVEMQIAPTGVWAKNYIGSTYGWTRTGGTVYHSGIDLYAEPGTPLYAICDGTISRTQRYVTGQPMRIAKDTYPEDYTGDTDAAGNRFTLEGNVQGEKVYFAYWHLNAGNPIAINPRTGQPFRPGDKVYRGEIIAYSGRTGNANNVDFPHLHLTVKNRNGVVINPDKYLNGTIGYIVVNDKKVLKSTDITGIQCDEDERILEAIYYQ